MSSATLPGHYTDETLAETATSPPRRAAGWVLMGDIVSARGGVPESIIQWRRAMEDSDPEPQL